MKKKIALITGITGQDGSYLTEFLLNKNYFVHGIKRKSSSFNTDRIDHLLYDKKFSKNIKLHYGDLNDFNSLIRIIKKIKPDEIYNLGAQTHVAASFDLPEYTCDINGLGVLRLLEIIRILKLKCKFYQASSSELFGKTSQKFLDEKSSFKPDSPYAAGKLFGYWITKNYRESYGIFASNGILFNHESPRRTPTFVTRKITRGLVRIIKGKEKVLELGNIYSKRDWGHSKDYVEMQWKILQQKKPLDIIIATGTQYRVKDFVDMCCKYLGIEIAWIGKGINEKAKIIKLNKSYKSLKLNQIIIKINKKYFRPIDVDNLKGNSSLAKKILNWKPKYSIKDLIKEMIDDEMNS